VTTDRNDDGARPKAGAGSGSVPPMTRRRAIGVGAAAGAAAWVVPQIVSAPAASAASPAARLITATTTTASFVQGVDIVVEASLTVPVGDPIEFHISLSADISGLLVLAAITTDGTAVFGTDYLAFTPTSPYVFPAGDIGPRTLTIPTVLTGLGPDTEFVLALELYFSA